MIIVECAKCFGYLHFVHLLTQKCSVVRGYFAPTIEDQGQHWHNHSQSKRKEKNLFIRGSLEYDPAVHILWNLFTESSEFNLHLKPTGDRPKAKLQTEV